MRAQEGETRRIEVDGISLLVTRKRIRSMRLVIHPPDGEVRASLPLRTSLAELLAFIASKSAWIRKHREAMLDTPRPAPPRYVGGELLPLWGERVLLEVAEGGGRPGLTYREGRFLLRVAPGSPDREALVYRWYRRELLAALPPLVAEWEGRLGVRIRGLSARRMKTRWGSCTARRGTIRLSVELAKKPPSCLEYVLVHEMAHLLEASHNARFKALLDRHLPDWRARRRDLSLPESSFPEDSSST